MNNNEILSSTTSVINELGMHARPASKIAQIAGDAKKDVWLCVDSQKNDATSIIDILSMCAVKGTQVRVEIEDESDRLILEQIVDFFESGFGEL